MIAIQRPSARRWTALVLPALLLAGCASGPDGGGACTVREISALTVLNASGPPVVAAVVNGHPVAMMIDTGGNASTIAVGAVRRLGLGTPGRRAVLTAGVDGEMADPLVPVPRLELGGSSARNAMFTEIADMPAKVTGVAIDGTIGADFLASYDVEFDLAARRIGLFVRSGACGADFTPWDVPSRRVPVARGGVFLALPITVNGARFAALIDSGTSLTTITRAEARDAGLSDADLAAGRPMLVVTVTGHVITERVVPVRDLVVGGLRTAPDRILVGPSGPAFLGADWLRRHRVWISYPDAMLLVAAPPSPPPSPPPAG